MRDFRSLKVWEKAHQLALDIYKAMAALPHEEQFGLTSRTRRCAASIGANGLVPPGVHNDLYSRTLEVKRMLATLIRRFRSDH